MSHAKRVNGRPDWAWIHLAFGSAAVMTVSAFYIASPSLAVAANLGVDLSLAQAATLTGSGSMRVAGFLGVLGDPFIAVGALAMARSARAQDPQHRMLGFYWLAVAAVLFTVVDALVGFALPVAARAGAQAFSVAKPLFDALTGGAAFAYGISGMLIGWPTSQRDASNPRWLTHALVVVGGATCGAAMATLWGVDGGLAIGIGLTVLTTLYTILGVKNAWTAQG